MGDNEHGIDDEFMATMLGDFLDESQGYLTNLNNNLLVLDQLVGSLDGARLPAIDAELLNDMFRDAHSLKGLSAMLQLSDINNLTHRIENVFDAARSERLTITRDAVDLMFQAFDRLTGMVEQLRDPTDQTIEYQTVSNQMQQLLEGSQDRSDNPGPHPAPEPATPDAQAALPSPSARSQSPAAEAAGAAADFELPTAVEVPSTPELDPLADVRDEAEIPAKYLSIFIDETQESLDLISETLLGETPTAIDPLLIRCHQIKGGAAAIGLNRAAKLAHLMEDLLQDLRESDSPLTDSLSDALIGAVDSLRAFVETLKRGTPGSDTFAEAFRRLRSTYTAEVQDASRSAALSEKDVSTPIDATADESQSALQSFGTPRPPVDTSALLAANATLSEDEQAQIADLRPAAATGVMGCICLEPGLPLSEVKAQLAVRRLEQFGELFFCAPNEAELAEAQEVSRLAFALVTAATPEQLRDQLEMDGIVTICTRPLPASSANEVIEIDDVVGEPTTTGSAAERNLAAGEQSTLGVEANTPCSDTIAPTAGSLSTPAPGYPREESTAQNVGGASPVTREPLKGAKGKPTETLRVDIERLDHLMNLTGQLVINKARFGQIADQFRGLAARKQSAQSIRNMKGVIERMLSRSGDASQQPRRGGSFANALEDEFRQLLLELEIVQSDVEQWAETRTLVNEFSEAMHQLERVSDGIQKSVMDTRMLPIGPLFARFKRVIRDITRSNGKDVQLLIRGEKTELDKRMIDELGDPLIHMVRNAADHGIESPEERRRVGKPTQGTVTLDAFHRGNRIFVQVRDDGRGLDPEKLRAKAISRGILSPQDAERLSAQQCYQLIWEPGFSTAESVTEISGRGMGMDIVRSKIEQLNGSIELDSQLGVGTTITVKLPLTLAILPSLLTVIRGDVFAIPVESVAEIVRVGLQDLRTVHGLTTARVRGRIVSVVELTQLFRWHAPIAPTPVKSEATLVIVGTDGNELGLVVDELLGEEDIVIKSLAENYRNVLGLAGASILGDGRVSLILDVSALLEMACQRSRLSGNHRSESLPSTPNLRQADRPAGN